MLLDRANRRYLAMCSQGGRDGHRDARVERPEALPGSRWIRSSGSTRPRPTRSSTRPASRPRSPTEIARRAAAARRCTSEEDATLVEVNPLVKTGDGKIIALDGKVSLDENADFRHPDHAALADKSAEDPLEAAAKAKGLNYVKLDGSGRDHRQRGRPGDEHPGRRRVRRGGVSRVAEAGELPRHRWRRQRGGHGERVGDHHLATTQVKSVFVNVFGGITACDAVANGIVQAFELLASRDEHVDVPLVVRLDGNNAELGRQILRRRESAGAGAGGHDGRCGPPGRRAGGELKGGARTWQSF